MSTTSRPAPVQIMSVLALLAAVSMIGPANAQQQKPTAAELAAELAAAVENENIQEWLGITWAAVVGAIFVYVCVLYGLRYMRLLSAMNSKDDRQAFFAIPNQRWASVKRNLLDAPLFRKRHNREFKLSSAVNVGTLPSRFQTLFLTAYFAMNVAFCVIDIDWSSPEMPDVLRNRAGVLAVMNMLPLFLLAGRNNPLITWLSISFDTFNLIHRWIGRIVVIEVITHTLAWVISTAQKEGWAIVAKLMSPAGHNTLILSGTISMSAGVAILFLSPSIVRHAWYEVFLHIHIILAALFLGAVWIHLKTLPQQALLYGVLSIWMIERFWRMYLIVRHNIGRRGATTRAEIEALPGDAVRVTLRLARPWKFQPGQHVFLHMPSVGLWTNHPFSVAWSEEEDAYDSEKGGLPVARQDVLSRDTTTTMSLIVRRRTGFTDKMYQKASHSLSGRFTTTAFVEGPYGSQDLTSYGTVLLFAAGVGITHQVPHVRALVAAHANGTAATRKVTLVWIIQSPEHLEWIRPWMTAILGMEKRRDVLRVLLFVTRPRSTKEIHSPSSSVQMFPGKPDVAAIVASEQQRQVGAMAVSVCGTGSLGDEVRKASREAGRYTTIDFVENAFSW